MDSEEEEPEERELLVTDSWEEDEDRVLPIVPSLPEERVEELLPTELSLLLVEAERLYTSPELLDERVE